MKVNKLNRYYYTEKYSIGCRFEEKLMSAREESVLSLLVGCIHEGHLYVRLYSERHEMCQMNSLSSNCLFLFQSTAFFKN